MKEIVVVSGKGGAGKSTITAGLSYFLKKNDVLVDADVDAPNLKILLEPEPVEEKDFYSGKQFKIEQDFCIRCGRCYHECSFEAIEIIKFDYVIDDIACEGCGLCQFICPTNAISVADKLTGKKYISKTKYGFKMVHALLNPAEENSGKLVADIKKVAKQLAKEQNASTIIVDGPPGIGCSAISAVSGSDIVLLVAESSISGLHDMERLIELSQNFKVKRLGFINKYGLNHDIDEKLVNLFESKGIEIVGYLNYSQDVPQYLKKKVNLPEYVEGYKKIFESLYKRIMEGVE
ncbi:ATP-binding protein [Deferribacterales bacterium Es71-Z0220]|uniref:ATP-binding protein n=1 Tax=Deferrivibrio essentukiensis TaxID=2880922 RepID=UPI001F619DED|nr:ATP-binding protein [Deferrivibrio essentukiensis]MCB4203552.1 ATP-binding protein [Deferrivibrio essentukiensis]